MERKQWYKDIAVYQIWPRSFCDGNGDGIGDLTGVIAKLDYIKSLGVDAIWFSPLYPSPNADYGYDIADYRDISSDYGTLEQFKTLLDEAHKRGLKIIMDLVINHTSDEHKWFKESKNPESPFHNYYFWRQGRNGGKKPPNNWLSVFEGGACVCEFFLEQLVCLALAGRRDHLHLKSGRAAQRFPAAHRHGDRTLHERAASP